MNNKFLTISIQCHNFQKRLCFMLSSLLEQTDKDFIIDISYLKNNGNPSTESVIDFFNKKGLIIKETVYNDLDRFQYRGLTRTDQMERCDTDFLLFADTDMVYNFKMIENLKDIINNDDSFVKYNGIMTCGRYSQPNDKINKTNFLVNSYVIDKPMYIEGVWDVVDSKLEKIGRKNVGAGFWQLINFNECDHKNYYVKDNECRDMGWTNGFQKASSDIQFRKRIGCNKKMPKWFSENQIHLNHNRDSFYKEHINEQR